MMGDCGSLGVSLSPLSGSGRDVDPPCVLSGGCGSSVVLGAGSPLGGVVLAGIAGTSLVEGSLVAIVGGDTTVVVGDAAGCEAGIVIAGKMISFAGVNAMGEPPGLTNVHCSNTASKPCT